MLSQENRLTLAELERIAQKLEGQAQGIRCAIEYSIRNETMKGLDEMVAMAFNAQQYQPQYGGGGGLPAGPNGEPVRYKVVIVNSSQENVEKNGMVTGGYLAFELTPIEGPLQGTKHTDRLNLHNTNPKVVEIANKQLSAYCHVLNKYQFNDTAELHNIPFIVEIGLQKAPNPNGYTEVKAIFDINGNEPGKAGNGPATGAPASPPPSAPPAAGVQAQGQGWGGAPQGQPDPNAGQPPAQAGWGGQQQQPPAQQPPQQQWGAPQGNPPQQGGQPGWVAPQQPQGAPPAQAGWGAPQGGQAAPGWGPPQG